MQPWDLSERLDAAPDAATAWQVGITAFESLGMAGVIWIDAAGPCAPRLRSTLGAEWEALNRRDLAAGIDPFSRHCLSRMTPLRTGAAHLDRYGYLPGEARHLVREAADRTGLSAGISLPVRSALDGRGQGWNLMAEGGAAELDAILEAHGTLLALSAHLVHARLASWDDPAWDGAAQPGPSLTPRERDCLAFVAEGHRTAEIAHRLGIAETTAEFHIANARRRLGARTRDHAVALALRAGLL